MMMHLRARRSSSASSRVRRRFFAVAAMAASSACPALGLDRHWNTTSGSWGISANWNPIGVPGSADGGIVDFWNFSSGVPGFAVVANNVGSSNFVRIQTGDTVRIGAQGVLGTVNDLTVGVDSTSGILNVTNTNPILAYSGRLDVGRDLLIGESSGPGTVNQNDGSVTVGSYVHVGSSRQPGSEFPGVGTYNLSGGALSTTGMTVGRRNATGYLNLAGGLAQTQLLYIGGAPLYPAGIGIVNHNAGTMLVNTAQINGGSVYNLSGGSYYNGFRTDLYDATFNYTGGSCYVENLILTRSRMQLGGTPGKVLQVNGLGLWEDSVIDLNQDSMTISTNDGSYLRQQIISGRNGGLWDGPGITSSTAAVNASSAHPTALGYGQSAGFQYLIKHTWIGDANLDAQVDVTDLGALATNWQTPGAVWTSGDFNYDGFVDVTDLGLLATNWQAGVNDPLAPSLADALRSLGLPAVPEPATTITALLGIAVAIVRRPNSALNRAKQKSAKPGL